MSFDLMKNYQRGGVIDTLGIARPNIVALARYIAHKAGIPEVRMQCTPGLAAHRLGLAVDIQPGPGNREAMNRLQQVVEELDWKFWRVRYAAVNRTEYGGSWGGKERKRPQTTNYGGSDPWHLNHLHIDVYADAPVRDWQSLIKGESAAAPVVSTKVKNLLAELEYKTVKEAQKDLGLRQDGVAGPITTEALENEMSKIREDLGKIKTATERNERRQELTLELLDALAKTVDDADLAHIRKRVEQNNGALSRIDPGKAGERK